MRFSIYSEMQYWGGKSRERLYAEVAEQVVHADRLGYSTYAIIEHLFFPRFSTSPDPLSFFCQLAPSRRCTPTKSPSLQVRPHAIVVSNPSSESKNSVDSTAIPFRRRLAPC